MNKVELNKYIESICTQIPLVNSFYTQDVYEIWNTKEVKYGSVSFYVQSSSVGEFSTTWTGLIYYADRLLEDKSNLDQIHTDAVNVITSVMNTIYIDEDIVSINFPTNVELFEQSFVDWLAGGYATIQIETDNSINGCGFGYVKEEEGCEGAINALNKEIEELQGNVEELEEEVEDKNRTIENQQNTIEAQQDTIENQEDTIEKQATTIETQEGAINALEEEVERLEESLSILPDYTSIGWNLETNDPFYQRQYDAINYAKSIQEEWDPSVTSLYNKFNGDKNLVYMPLVDTSNVANMQGCFQYCHSLASIPQLDTSNVTSMYGSFRGCSSLITIPQLDTSNVTNMDSCFYGCTSLTSIPQLDTSNVANIGSCFYGCTSLTSIPQLVTSNVTNIRFCFYGCTSLTSIPQLDTSNVTSMQSCFYNCNSLVTIPQLDTSKVQNMENCFSNCTSLVTIPQLDTSKVTNMYYCFGNCLKLESLPLFDFSSVTNISTFFGYSNINTLTDLGGFTGLKIDWTGYGSLKQLPNLTVQSLLNVFNTIADVTDLGGRKLEIGTTNLNKLTDEQKQIAINKGWTLS